MATTRSLFTRDNILDAAEQLFAHQGHDNTSMRQITGAAQVNLSAVNYHFGSKDGLIQAVFRRRLDALNQERLLLLNRLERDANGKPLKPSHVVEAFFGPLVRHASQVDAGQQAFIPLLERSMSDHGGLIRTLSTTEHADVFDRFKQALLKALPGVPETEIVWRFHFMLGATSYALMGTDALRAAMHWPADPIDEAQEAQQLLPRLMSFLLGGLRAPLPTAATTPLAAHTKDTTSTLSSNRSLV